MPSNIQSRNKLVSVFLVVGAILFNPDKALSEENNAKRFIEVNGTGTVFKVPDEAVVTVGVKTYNKDIRSCYKENQQMVGQILAMAAKHKINSKDVQTSEISVVPAYSSSESRSRKFDGFYVEKSVSIVIKNLQDLPVILAEAIESGANVISSVNLRIENPRKQKDEARVLALKAAKEKAESMATELNCKIGKVLSAQEGISSMGGLNSRYDSIQSTNMFQVMPTTAMHAYVSNGDIAQGQIKIDSSVSAKFEIVD